MAICLPSTDYIALGQVHPRQEILPEDEARGQYYLLSVNNIRIFDECEVQIEKSVRGSLFGITRLRRVMPNSDAEGRIFLSAPNNNDRVFFLHTL